MRRSAFTLVEILVVIALLALLMAMLFPVFSQAKLPAKGVGCLTNLHSIGTAVALYASDADNRYPIATDPTGKNSGSFPEDEKLPQARDVLQPYTRSGEIWRCPLDNGVPDVGRDANEATLTFFPGTSPSMFAKYRMSYGYNGGLGGRAMPVSMWDGAHAEHGPAEIPVAMDLLNRWHGDRERPWANLLFADDHVKRMDYPRNIQSGTWTFEP